MNLYEKHKEIVDYAYRLITSEGMTGWAWGRRHRFQDLIKDLKSTDSDSQRVEDDDLLDKVLEVGLPNRWKPKKSDKLRS